MNMILYEIGNRFVGNQSGSLSLCRKLYPLMGSIDSFDYQPQVINATGIHIIVYIHEYI